MTATKRSPIKEAPLPAAGDSLRARRDRLWDDRLESPLVVAAMAGALAVAEWLQLWLDTPPMPVTLTVLALVCVAFFGWRARKVIPEIRRLKLAEAGERKVGQELEKARAQGYEVFHDVPGPGFNIDHVLVGPAGVICAETKTWSKPVDGEAKIAFDGETITVLPTGWRPERDPVAQARALADWLHSLLRQSTGRDLFVRPVVLFPGWWIDQGKGTTKQVWVLEPKALGAFLSKDAERLSAEDAKLASFHLTQYVRSISSLGNRKGG